MVVKVSVGLSGRVASAMRVLMVLIVRMRMRMLHQLMLMFMVMIFGEVQPDAERHQ
jgi:hypothetical protein